MIASGLHPVRDHRVRRLRDTKVGIGSCCTSSGISITRTPAKSAACQSRPVIPVTAGTGSPADQQWCPGCPVRILVPLLPVPECGQSATNTLIIWIILAVDPEAVSGWPARFAQQPLA